MSVSEVAKAPVKAKQVDETQATPVVNAAAATPARKTGVGTAVNTDPDYWEDAGRLGRAGL